MKKYFNKWIIPLTLVVGILLGVLFQEIRISSKIDMRHLESIIQAYGIAKENAIEEFDQDRLVAGMIYGLAASLNDEYAYYFTPEEHFQYNENKNGIFQGVIGATITKTEQDVIVTDVYPDSPAQKVGIKVGDVLLQVEDADVSNMSGDEIAECLMGENGTKVRIRIKRGENELVFEPERAQVVKPMITYRQMDDITYIKFSSFNGDATEKFKQAIKLAQDESSKGIIIDLRDNLGGKVNVMAECADIVLPEGDIIYALDRNGNRVMEKKSNAYCINIPIVIITNAYTASASEAFTGAARDYGVAKVVGTQTYGKGIMQTTYKLLNNGAFKLTNAKYYLPKGECIHQKGITPDYVVKLPNDLQSRPYYMTDEQDTQLQKALELLN